MSGLNSKALLPLNTLNAILTWGSAIFEKNQLYFGHGTNNSWDEALLLSLYALNLVYQDDPELLKRKLSEVEKQRIFNLFNRRIEQRIPAPYLTHEAYFAGLAFYVDERVVIPRSPIAELIEQRFSPWVAFGQVQRILELCSGSGCMAIAAAYVFEQVEVDAIELSKEALAVAKINCEKHLVTDRVHLKQSDLFNQIPDQRYDIIFSNPPYVSTCELAKLPAEYHHEPCMGLQATGDGLAIVKRILHESCQHLNEGGILIVEVGYQAENLARQYPKVPFTWLEFARGGEGVFLLTKEQLQVNFCGADEYRVNNDL